MRSVGWLSSPYAWRCGDSMIRFFTVVAPIRSGVQSRPCGASISLIRRVMIAVESI